jgi:hypothetical protein
MHIFLFPKIAFFKKGKTFQKFLFQAWFPENGAYICPHKRMAGQVGLQSSREDCLVLMKSICGGERDCRTRIFWG